MIATLAASAALAFAPPLDRPLRYDTTERRPRPDGTMRAATLTQEVVFAPDADGYAMTIRTTGYRAATPAGKADAFDVVMRPMVGSTVRIHLSAGGVPERVIDGAASWAAMLAALRAEIASYPAGDAEIAPAATMLATLAATPPQARDARLLAAADDLLAAHLPPLAVGAQDRGTNGTTLRTPDVGADAHYREEAVQAAGGRSLRTDATIAVSRVTGLVTHSLRRTTVDGASAPPLAECETVLTD